MANLTPATFVLFCAALGLVISYVWVAVAAAARVRFKHSLSAEARLEPWEDDDPEPEAERVLADLRELGFVVRGQWRHTGHSAATGIITLLEHPQTLDSAKVMVTSARSRRSHVALVFQTRFADGTEVAAANNQLTAGFPPLPAVTVLWLPEERDPRRLYRIHEQLRDHVGAGRKCKPIGPDPLAFLVEGIERMHAHMVATGYFFHDPAGNVLRPTWKGAVLTTWRQLWPLRPIFRARRRRPTQRLLRELGIRDDSVV
jgi:hypothetical protein